MEQLSKEENTAFEIPLVKPEGLLPLETESSKEQTDKVKHTSEQSGLIFFHLPMLQFGSRRQLNGVTCRR